MDISAGNEMLARMAIDAGTTPGVASPALGSPGSAAVSVQAGYDVNLSTDVTAFQDSLARAAQRVDSPSPVGEAVFERLDSVNAEAKALLEYAEEAVASGNELTPSEIVTLTAHSQEFMFHAQLTANMANRTAEGLQQLFRQQS